MLAYYNNFVIFQWHIVADQFLVKVEVGNIRFFFHSHVRKGEQVRADIAMDVYSQI